MLDLLSKYLLGTTIKAFVLILLWRIGVNPNHIVAFVCTYYVCDSLNRLRSTIGKYYLQLGNELLVQSRILAKLANTNDVEVAKEIQEEARKSYEAKYATN